MVNRQVTEDEKKSVSLEKIEYIEKKVRDYVLLNNLISAGDVITIGVSGGADSLCLLFLLTKLFFDSVSIKVVHIHHGLRQSADEEAEYVMKICDELGVECTIVKVDVKKYAKDNKLSTEEAGREIRYEAFRNSIQDYSNGKIAIAHNKNDNAETVLFNMFRGASLNGMRGIRPGNDNIIRPILCLSREEVEEYLKGRGINFCTDESNLTNDYARNRIRHEILPVAENTINNRAVDNMFKLSEDVSSAMDYLDTVLNETYSLITDRKEESIIIYREKLFALHDYLQGRVLYKAVVEMSGKMKDIEKKHIKILLNLFDKQVGRFVSLPYDLCAIRIYEGIEVKKKIEEKISYSRIELIPGVKTLFGGYEITIEEDMMPINALIPKEKYTKWFDCDKIKGLVVCRNPIEGDFIEINENGDRQTLKRYCINEKIPLEERKKLALICDEESVLWIIGRRISSRIKISDKTKRILKFDVSINEKCGR